MTTTISTKKITAIAAMIALCTVFQAMKGISPYITGSAVNAILIISALSTGWVGGLVISCLTPIFAYILGLTPLLQMIPIMVFVIAVGNASLVVTTLVGFQMKEKSLPITLLLGSAIKALILWVLVWFVVLPIFGAELPDAVVLAAKASFSVMQLITAIIGSVIAFAVHMRIKNLYI